MDSESTTYVWPRQATPSDTEQLEGWLAERGWEVDPTVYMAGAGGAAVQVRRAGAVWADGEPGLLILPAETVVWDGARIRIAPPSAVPATAVLSVAVPTVARTTAAVAAAAVPERCPAS
ncbi:hypothetical protein OS965_04535 [Streptomyces sp. H27-G5]|uniref:hypothetical protein n=1 Tax=Streptomyces sp. H27-G5 TaxID=2996698 RepID=UPI0022707C87|nr:hypothetical protein [Streptomyces sp. H27-G5]MCY0917445.1 hypothetical protein [Streptomyces sp. H27-G5]